MKFVNKYWKKALGILAVVSILVFAFWYGGNSGDSRGFNITKSTEYHSLKESLTKDGIEDYYRDSSGSASDVATDKDSEAYTHPEQDGADDSPDDEKQPETEMSGEAGKQSAGEETTKSEGDAQSENTSQSVKPAQTSKPAETLKPSQAPKPAETLKPSQAPKPAETVQPTQTPKPTQAPPAEVTKPAETPKRTTCTISISCSTILNNMDRLDKSKRDIIPADGWILRPVTVEFTEGESVYDVLLRTTKDNRIHMESTYVPLYGSVYIEGIYNIYEFDCGELSGWMYSVNDVFINYGSSNYTVKDKDVIKFVYTCNLGNDVGGGYSVGS